MVPAARALAWRERCSFCRRPFAAWERVVCARARVPAEAITMVGARDWKARSKSGVDPPTEVKAREACEKRAARVMVRG